MASLHYADTNTEQYFLSCDWGTTSFRLKFIDVVTGQSLSMDGISDSDGIKKINGHWNEYNGSLSRVDFYLSFLEKKIKELEKKLKVDLSPGRVIISGMASSSIGIKELPYRSLPIAMKSLNLHVEKLPASHQLPHEVYLVSGVRSSRDIMRGEETQLLGLNFKYGLDTGIYLLAGTHSKHVYIENKTVVDFKTYMTGELFGLISSQSILSQSVSISKSTRKSASPGRAFEEGVRQSLQGNILHSLFEIRAHDLLQNVEPAANADYLSGLLIGTELADLSDNSSQEVIIFGNSVLQKNYSRACKIMNINFRTAELDASEDITALGQRIILQQLSAK